MQKKLSIITINRNNALGLENTVKSIICQSYNDYEYIVIDGASDDSSVDVIKKFENQITHWISEPDKGIYDAMNKGIDLASGEWICFMNSGDTFCEKSILENIFIDNCQLLSDSEVIYGNTEYTLPMIRYMLRPDPVSNIVLNMPFCHQSSFVKAQLQKENKFDVSYKICADHAFLLYLYKTGCRFKYIDLTISNFDGTTGMSVTHGGVILKEKYRVRGFKPGFNMYLDLYKIRLRKIFSNVYNALCSRSNLFLRNKIKRMSKRDNIGWVLKK